MHPNNTLGKVISTVALLGLSSTPVSATTLIRSGLESMTAQNEMVVHARVVDFQSYWNSGHSLIFTDVRMRPLRFMKGHSPGTELVITLVGGTVDDLTTLIVGGPELVPGSEYVLFLSRRDLPGAGSRLGVRDLAQGVFEVVDGVRGRRAVSQAIHQPLIPDASGISNPPGGPEGLSLEDLARTVRTVTGGR